MCNDRVSLCLGFILQLALVLFDDPAYAQEFEDLVQLDFRPSDRAAQSELIIAGINRSDEPQALFFKITDGKGQGYYQRFNAERLVLPGRFRLFFPLHGLKRQNGKALDAHQNWSASVFAYSQSYDQLDISDHFIHTRTSHNNAILALDFGPKNSPVFPGFQGAHIGMPGLHCETQCIERQRPYDDSLIGDGISGVTALRLPVPNGLYHLHLWTEDTGAWETYPHFLERRIKQKDRILIHQRYSPKRWQDERYRKLGTQSPADQSAWDHFGRHRGDRLDFMIAVKNGMLALDLAGNNITATHLAALMLVPMDHQKTVLHVDNMRKRRFNARWPVIPADESLEALFPFDQPVPPLARDGQIFHHLSLKDQPTSITVKAIHAPQFAHDALDMDIWAITPQLARISPNQNWLSYQKHKLVPVTSGDHVHATDFIIRVKGKTDQKMGIYQGGIEWIDDQGHHFSPLSVKALPITRPDPDQFIGAYIEDSPLALHGLEEPKHIPQCHLSILKDFGLDPIAMPSHLEDLRNQHQFLDAIKSFSKSNDSIFAYAQPKEMKKLFLPKERLDRIAHFSKAASRLGKRIIWSLADEPGHGMFEDIRRDIQILRGLDPNIQVAGHFNHPKQRNLSTEFDIIIANHAFGLESDDIAAMQRNGQDLWLYNMPDPRLAAGVMAHFWGAKGYLQWHTAMPTAHPLDPTDGREGDVFLIHAHRHACEGPPIIDLKLVALARAKEDLKWLSWMKSQNGTRYAELKQMGNHLLLEDEQGWTKMRTSLYETMP